MDTSLQQKLKIFPAEYLEDLLIHLITLVLDPPGSYFALASCSL